MAPDTTTAQYRKTYSKLIQFYSRPYRERFGEGMEQTFGDLCRERRKAGRKLFPFALWVFAETCAGIVRERRATMLRENKRLFGIVTAITMLLMVPLIAMQFNNSGVEWTLTDFIGAGIMLYGTGIAFELAARRSINTAYKVAAGLALGGALLLTWINLAVGIIGSENNLANLGYVLVIQVGVIGAGMSRFKPKGMAKTLFAMAIACALVPIAALAIWTPTVTQGEGPGVAGVFMLNSFFVGVFALSGFLFQHSGEVGST